MQTENKRRIWRWLPWLVVLTSLVFLAAPSLTRPPSRAQEDKPKDAVPSSYDQVAPVLLGKESFQTVRARDNADKDAVMARQKKLLEERYDLTRRVDDMHAAKPLRSTGGCHTGAPGLVTSAARIQSSLSKLASSVS